MGKPEGKKYQWGQSLPRAPWRSCPRPLCHSVTSRESPATSCLSHPVDEAAAAQKEGRICVKHLCLHFSRLRTCEWKMVPGSVRLSGRKTHHAVWKDLDTPSLGPRWVFLGWERRAGQCLGDPRSSQGSSLAQGHPSHTGCGCNQLCQGPTRPGFWASFHPAPCFLSPHLSPKGWFCLTPAVSTPHFHSLPFPAPSITNLCPGLDDAVLHIG